MAKFKLSPTKKAAKRSKENVRPTKRRSGNAGSPINSKTSSSNTTKTAQNVANSRLGLSMVMVQTTRLTRKISQNQSSKWKSIQTDCFNFVLSLLEDSLTRFSRPGNKEVMQIQKTIRTTFVRELKSAKMPAEKYIDVKSLKSAEEALLAEKKRLDQLELKLSSALKKEEKLTKQLQENVNTVDATPLPDDEDYHPILKKII